jgi:hypothetical protein
MKFPSKQRHLLLLLLSTAAVAIWLLVFGSRSSPVVILSSNPAFRTAVTSTSGTNHVYYYGNAVDRILDLVIRLLSDTNAYRLLHHTDDPSTMV